MLKVCVSARLNIRGLIIKFRKGHIQTLFTYLHIYIGMYYFRLNNRYIENRRPFIAFFIFGKDQLSQGTKCGK